MSKEITLSPQEQMLRTVETTLKASIKLLKIDGKGTKQEVLKMLEKLYERYWNE